MYVLYLGLAPLLFHAVADDHLAEDAPPKDHARLQRQVISLTEENNLLRYKVELLLDMVSGCLSVWAELWQMNSGV